MPSAKSITRDRAVLIARSHACEHCKEYSFKRLVVKPASKAHRAALRAAWHIERTCGVCGLEQELGLDVHGDIVFIG